MTRSSAGDHETFLSKVHSFLALHTDFETEVHYTWCKFK